MSRTVYAIASGKGGVGKTTTAVNLGAALAEDGHAVVVVDTDLGMANLAGFLDFDSDDGATLHEVLAGEADIDDAVYAAPGDIDVVPSNTDIEAFARADTTRLREVVEELRGEYDYVLLDTGAGISHDTVLPLGLADEVLLVSTPDVASVSDTAKTGDLTERVGGTVAGAVLNKRSSNILDATDVEETLGTDVLAVVPADDAVPMSIDAGRPTVDFAPASPAALVYDTLAAVLTADDVDAIRAEVGNADPEAGPTDADDVDDADDADDVTAAIPFGTDFEEEIGAADGEGWDELAAEADGADAFDEPGADDLLGLDSDVEREFRDVLGEAEEDDERAPEPEPTAGDTVPDEGTEPETVGDDADPDAIDAEADAEATRDGSDPEDADGSDSEVADDGDEAGTSAADADESAADPDSDVAAYIEPAEGGERPADGTGEAAADGSEPDEDPAADGETELGSVLGGEGAEEEEDEEAADAEGGFFGKLTGMFSR